MNASPNRIPREERTTLAPIRLKRTHDGGHMELQAIWNVSDTLSRGGDRTD